MWITGVKWTHLSSWSENMLSIKLSLDQEPSSSECLLYLLWLRQKNKHERSEPVKVSQSLCWFITGPHPRSRPGRAREAGAPRNAPSAQEADRSVPDDEEQPLPRECGNHFKFHLKTCKKTVKNKNSCCQRKIRIKSSLRDGSFYCKPAGSSLWEELITHFFQRTISCC